MRDILAVIEDHLVPSHSTRYAADLAALLEGSLTALFVSDTIRQPGGISACGCVQGAAVDRACREKTAERAFLTFAAGIVKRSQWLVAGTELVPALAWGGNWHDFVVVGRGWSASVPEIVCRLQACGMPCIVVPDSNRGHAALDLVAIAWNGSNEAIRAVQAALPLLRRAKRVLLIKGKREQPFSSIDYQPPFTIEGHLALHGIPHATVPLRAEGAEAGAALLSMASEHNVDLLVMGAYGRSQFSEWLFGGATRHVLEHARLPVLMRH